MPWGPITSCSLVPRLGCVACVALIMGAACSAQEHGGALLPTLDVASVGPAVIVPGTRLVVHGTGFTTPEVAALLVLVEGRVEGVPIEIGRASCRERVYVLV